MAFYYISAHGGKYIIEEMQPVFFGISSIRMLIRSYALSLNPPVFEEVKT